MAAAQNNALLPGPPPASQLQLLPGTAVSRPRSQVQPHWGQDGRAGVGAQPLRQFTPCSPLRPHLLGEGTPAVAAKQKESNNSSRHGNRTECLLYTSDTEAYKEGN